MNTQHKVDALPQAPRSKRFSRRRLRASATLALASIGGLGLAAGGAEGLLATALPTAPDAVEKNTTTVAGPEVPDELETWAAPKAIPFTSPTVLKSAAEFNPSDFSLHEGELMQQGAASFYGDGFHGRQTANGEIFDRNLPTAAHRTLPLGSIVRVTNIANGKSIVVRVNDRGPYHGNRILDLSEGAARDLGFIDQGTTRVRIERL
jgi:rare lipoprotein A